ncbi:MAG: hypothetical protein HYX69_19415 [Planctomycetia bacterium]|nr:hypothetical protein [Planctomycetia bacterium]
MNRCQAAPTASTALVPLWVALVFCAGSAAHAQYPGDYVRRSDWYAADARQPNRRPPEPRKLSPPGSRPLTSPRATAAPSMPGARAAAANNDSAEVRTRRAAQPIASEERRRQEPAAEVQSTGYEWHPNRRTATRAGTARQPTLALLPEREVIVEGDGTAVRAGGRPRYRSASAVVENELPPGGQLVQPEPESVDGIVNSGVPYDDGSGMAYEGDGDGYGGFGDECGDAPFGPVTDGCIGPYFPYFFLNESSVFVGTHAFKGGLDQGQNGNFGFQEGVNFAGSLWHSAAIGYQVGGNFVQSNLSGSQVLGLTDAGRDQVFLTAGMFHRPFYGNGLQGGIVWDWLDDQFYTHTRFSQIRTEVSYIVWDGNEGGFWGAFGTGRNQSRTVDGSLQTFAPTDLFAFFYRKTTATGGQGRLWAGFTGNRDGLVGADFRVPLSNRWDMIGGFNYLVPRQGQGSGGFSQESWGIAINLVWYPTRPHSGVHNGPFRSLLPVADNNVFMINKVQ